MTEPISHWAIDMEAGREPRCTGFFQPFQENDLYVLATCDKCRQDIGISRGLRRDVSRRKSSARRDDQTGRGEFDAGF